MKIKLGVYLLCFFLLLPWNSALLGMEKETIPTPADRAFNHAPSIVEIPGQGLLVAWYSGSKEKNRDTAIFFSFKKSGSQKWSTPRILIDTPSRADGNPVLFFKNKEIYCFYSVLWGTGWSTARLFYVKSLVEPKEKDFSWSPPCRISPFYKTGELMRGKPVALNEKSFFLPLYQELFGYSSYLYLIREGKVVWRSSYLKSSPGNLQPVIVPLPTLWLMFMRSARGGYLWEATSRNQGKTWSKPVKRKDLPQPNSGFDALRLSSGRIILVFHNNPKDTHSLNISISEDGGKSFSLKKVIEENKKEKFLYPSVIQDAKGKIHIVYTVNKKEIRHIVLGEKELLESKEKTSDFRH
ncbi:MAG: exo-alpha-sialidase [Caldiserica bacterium]|nr:exo-alpha-sialidase [Caldisericota bacterium]